MRGGIKCWRECKANERRGLLSSHYTCGVQLDNNNNNDYTTRQQATRQQIEITQATPDVYQVQGNGIY